MSAPIPLTGAKVVIGKSELARIFNALSEEGLTLVGPTREGSAIIYEEIESVDDLPLGWADNQSPGSYTLNQVEEAGYFDYVVGPNSLKSFLYPAKRTFFTTIKDPTGFLFKNPDVKCPKYAFIGVRACELAAVGVQDKVFIEGSFIDQDYLDRRERVFMLAVNCNYPAATCFCTSMRTGPECQTGFDLAMTELRESFLLEVGSPLGAQILSAAEWRLANALEINSAKKKVEEAVHRMSRSLETQGISGYLLENLDDPHWDSVAERCLSCANCTMVCPTCFCTDVVDVSDLNGDQTARERVWDSCFNPDFSYVFGGNLRPNIRARYRQWLTHKLGSWEEQFGVLGCVGCGRCITWCPVGIDLTAEIAAIRQGGAR